MQESADGYFQHVFRKVSASIKASGAEASISQAFAKLRNNDERIRFLLDSPIIKPVLDIPFVPNVRSSVSAACALREEGNRLFKEKLYQAALEKYSKSIICCSRSSRSIEKLGDSCLPLSYANRSAVWYHQGEFECCVSDVDAALQRGYPTRLAHKLYERKARCLIGLYKFEDAAAAIVVAKEAVLAGDLATSEKLSFCSALQRLEEERVHKRDLFTSHPISLQAKCSNGLSDGSTCCVPSVAHSTNKLYGSLSAKVGVKDDEVQGRHIVAEFDLNVGDIILAEEPFASVLLPSCYSTHCFCCFKRFRTFYPCRGCSSALYCSLLCESLSWTAYHQFECDNIEVLAGCGISMGHLALRAALDGGLDYHTEQTSAGRHADWESKLPRRVRDYRRVFNLESHEVDRSPSDLFFRSLAAVYLALCTRKPTEGSEPPLLTLAVLTLHHLQVFPCNAHEISEQRHTVGSAESGELVGIGAGIYASLSLFNHSCDPCVTRTFYGRRAIVRCLRPLSPGEQAFDNYGILYATDTLAERKAKLRRQYYFECSCVACSQDWPLYCVLASQSEEANALRLRCSRCRAASSSSLDSACASCHLPLDRGLALVELHDAKDDLADCVSRVCVGECGEDLVQRLVSILTLLHRLVSKPYKTFNDCEETLKHCFNRSGNCHFLSSS